MGGAVLDSRETGETGTEGALCPLQYAAGRVEACPGAACPFWEEGGAVVEAGCAVQRLGLPLEEGSDLVSWLLRVRTALREAGAPEERRAALHLFHLLLPPGLGD